MARIDQELAKMSRQLKKLDEKVRKKIMRAANRKSLKVVVDVARSLAQSEYHGSGFLASQITQASGRGSAYRIVNRVGVQGGARKKDKPGALKKFLTGAKDAPANAYYWRFLEFGTSKMEAKPFLRPAWESSRWGLFSIVKKEVRRGIELEARRLRKL